MSQAERDRLVCLENSSDEQFTRARQASGCRADDDIWGVQLSYETIRRWCDEFSQSYAAELKRRRAKLGDKWRLDEVLLKINCVQHYLWRAIDQHGTVIEILVQPNWDRLAAIRFFRKL